MATVMSGGGATVTETKNPRKRIVDYDKLPPAREGAVLIPRRFSGRVYECLASEGMRGDGMTLTKSAETYGVCAIRIIRNCVGVNQEYWSAGDEIEGCPVNVAIDLVNAKCATFDRSEFQGEGEIEALEKLGYQVSPPMQKVRDKKEFQSVIARKRSTWVKESLDPALKVP